MEEQNIKRALEALSGQTPRVPRALLESMVLKAKQYERERADSDPLPEDDIKDEKG
ncbi:MAG: hypothetical protein IKG98_10320 [Ruminococcus sp.]|nr:hypothetical protein [Ruminococcus sp.]MBR5164692.1 hypothetical protein [Ruminococcus sp.]MCR5015883.1 hypothetical protein [Ruminococcus sp.]